MYDIRTKCYKKVVDGREYEYCYAEILDPNRSDSRNRIVIKRLRLDRKEDVEELRRIVILNEIEGIRNTLYSLMKKLEFIIDIVNDKLDIVSYIATAGVKIRLNTHSCTPAGKNGQVINVDELVPTR